MMAEAKNYYKKLKDSGLFENGVPPMAHTYSWSFLNMLKDKVPKNPTEIEVKKNLDGSTWITL